MNVSEQQESPVNKKNPSCDGHVSQICLEPWKTSPFAPVTSSSPLGGPVNTSTRWDLSVPKLRPDSHATGASVTCIFSKVLAISALW